MTYISKGVYIVIEVLGFIRVKTGAEKEVLNDLISLNEVMEACLVFGEFDIIVHFKLDIDENLPRQSIIINAYKIIGDKLGKIKGIESMLLLPVSESYIKKRDPIQVEIPIKLEYPPD
jgi:hypothetical protein